MAARSAILALLATSACATSTPSPVRSTAPPPGRSHPASAAPERPAPFRCGPADREWNNWFDSVFGHGSELRDGPDPARARALSGGEKAHAIEMLRRGLGACDIFAVEVIEGADWREMVPDLERVEPANDEDFRARTIVALQSLGADEHTDHLIALLTASSVEARMTAAIGARRFSLAALRGPLLERVRRDPSSLVRHHAAESLLELADVYPRDLFAHPALAAAILGKGNRGPGLGEMFGLQIPLSADDQALCDAGAAELDSEISARLEAGRCAPPVPLQTLELHSVPLNEHALALLAEESVGSCERTLAFVIVVRAPGGLDEASRFSSVFLSHGTNEVQTSIGTLPAAVPLRYRLARHLLTVGGQILDTSRTNVAVLSVNASGVSVAYQQFQALRFSRDRAHRPAQASWAMANHAEVEATVHQLLDRSAELRKLVADRP